MHQDNLKDVKLFGLCHGFKVCTGACYPGSYIGGEDSKHEWSKERTETWERNICTIRKTVRKYP